LKPKSYLLLRI